MKIVSFTGPKGSGKDTGAAILAEKKISSGKISFAGPMKEILSKILGIPLEAFEDPSLKEKPFETPITLSSRLIRKILKEMTDMLDPYSELDYHTTISLTGLENVQLTSPRQALQFIGTEMIRNRIHPDWHVAAAFRRAVVSKLDPKGIYCVTDARFANEYLWLERNFKRNFVGFYVERPEAEELLESATHASELAVKEVKLLIPESNILKNDGTVNDLKKLLLSKRLDAAPTAEQVADDKASKFKFEKAKGNEEGSF